MSLKDPHSKLMRWKLKLDEFNYHVEYKKGQLNSNADALSRIKPKFQIIETTKDIFENNNNIVHCISADKKLGKDFALQINNKFKSKNYLFQFLNYFD